jgi:hypothetical protein
MQCNIEDWQSARALVSATTKYGVYFTHYRTDANIVWPPPEIDARDRE